MTLDLTDDETRALVAHLRHAIEYDPFPFAPRLDPLKAVLAKLEPPAPQPEPSGLGWRGKDRFIVFHRYVLNICRDEG